MKLFAEPFGITDYDFYYPSRRMRLERIFIPAKSYTHMAYVSEIAKKCGSVSLIFIFQTPQ